VQGYTFGEIYPRAKTEISYVNEKQALEGLFNDCCKVIVLSRSLTKDEQKKFENANIFIKQVFIAKDALAFVVSNTSPDSTLSAEKVNALLSGSDTSYKMVFDNQNSGVARYLKDSVLLGKSFGKNCFAVKNTDELIQTTSSSKNVIGILDYAWLSDKDETITKEILKKVRPLPVSMQEKDVAYYPDQSNIETRDYPFCRWVYMVQRGGDFTPAAGFISFVAGQKGQLIMLKSGLMPAMRQERVIEINTAPLGNQ
jgi:phosphate transport system substrate-binding protein